MKRSTRLEIAKDTVAVVQRGSYALPDGRVVDLSAAVGDCLDATREYSPDDRPAPGPSSFSTTIEVRNETTLAGVARLIPEGPVAALNFASAKNPGGGFLNGSEAQEESLARSSALYASLLRAPTFYARHRAMASCLYSDALIFSPGCPIFRDDDGRLLETPHAATIITSPAPNAGAVARNSQADVRLLAPTLRRRAGLVLTLASHHGYRRLVLGAWGCGVFRNSPAVVAEAYQRDLEGPFKGVFDEVVFAVLDWSEDRHFVRPFADRFAG